MALFDNFIPLIIPLEGEKLTNIKGDAGGLTKYGISKAAFPLVDIANLTFEEACTIYRKSFWEHYALSAIDCQSVANKIMSLLINANPFSIVQAIQRAINHCGGGTAEDGLLGINTYRVINALPQNRLLDRIRIEAALFYVYRVKINPSQIKFLEGWMNRALS